MIDKLKTADMRNLILLIMAVLFFILSIIGRLSEQNIMNLLIMAFTWLFAKQVMDKNK